MDQAALCARAALPAFLPAGAEALDAGMDLTATCSAFALACARLEASAPAAVLGDVLTDVLVVVAALPFRCAEDLVCAEAGTTRLPTDEEPCLAEAWRFKVDADGTC